MLKIYCCFFVIVFSFQMYMSYLLKNVQSVALLYSVDKYGCIVMYTYKLNCVPFIDQLVFFNIPKPFKRHVNFMIVFLV